MGKVLVVLYDNESPLIWPAQLGRRRDRARRRSKTYGGIIGRLYNTRLFGRRRRRSCSGGFDTMVRPGSSRKPLSERIMILAMGVVFACPIGCARNNQLPASSASPWLPPPATSSSRQLPPISDLPQSGAAIPAVPGRSFPNIQRPNWTSPGTIRQQQRRATLHDPYADNTVGPEIVGGRPREYARPPAEPVRSTLGLPYWPF